MDLMQVMLPHKRDGEILPKPERRWHRRQSYIVQPRYWSAQVVLRQLEVCRRTLVVARDIQSWAYERSAVLGERWDPAEGSSMKQSSA